MSDDRLTPEEIDAGDGTCVHQRHMRVRDAVGAFFAARPPNPLQRVDVQLKAHLEGVAGRPLTPAQVLRALRLWVDSR